MEIEKIEQIMKLLKRYDLQKVYIESDNIKLEIQDHKNVTDSFKSLECTNKENINNELQIINDNEEYIIKSPLVGTVSILENKATCKKYFVGDKIKNGQALCNIEAMKMLNEITCKQEGIITEILIEDSQFVEYDQPLFKIREKGEKNV